MNPVWFLRMARWVRHPASAGRVKLVLAVALACLALWGLERLLGWPEWLTPGHVPAGRIAD